jgi:hypothetical protein
MNVLSLLKYWKYGIILILGVTLFIGYKLYKIEIAKNIQLSTVIDFQRNLITTATVNQSRHIKAVVDKNNTIQQLETQIDQMSSTLEELYQQDEQVLEWSRQEFPKSVIDKIIYTPITIDHVEKQKQ